MPQSSLARSVDSESFRAVLGCFATGVTVVTTRDDEGAAHAITVGSFTSVSLEPPLILYCLGKSAFGFEVFAAATGFAVNVLAADQSGLSDRFAREVPDAFPDLATSTWVTGSPVIEEGLAALDCERAACHEAGDHLIVVGRVKALGLLRQSDPLVYCRGRYRGLQSFS